MTTYTEVQDVFACAVPEGVDAGGLERQALIAAHLLPLALDFIQLQYQEQDEAPEGVLVDRTDWLITNQPDDIEGFQPAHDCADCRAGGDRARAFLAEHPDRWVALANLHYREVWP